MSRTALPFVSTAAPAGSGRYELTPDDPGGAQVLVLVPAAGGFVETAFPEAGTYPFVSHVMVDAERGARGAVVVNGPEATV